MEKLGTAWLKNYAIPPEDKLFEYSIILFFYVLFLG